MELLSIFIFLNTLVVVRVTISRLPCAERWGGKMVFIHQRMDFAVQCK